jgi:ureidoglycolate lyase
MMPATLRATPLTASAFAPFGQIIEAQGDSSEANQGRAQRFDAPLDMALPDNGLDDRAAPHAMRLHTAIYRIRKSALPFELKLVERHPLSQQLFFPNSGARFLVCACAALGNGEPDLRTLRAFVGQRTQGIVWRKNVWHSPFAALDADGDFMMQQWQCGGPEDCEERPLGVPIMIEDCAVTR